MSAAVCVGSLSICGVQEAMRWRTVKILERTIFAKFTAYPLPSPQLEFHPVLADTNTKSDSTIATSLYPKVGVKWWSYGLLVPVRSGMSQCDVSAGLVGDWHTPIERQRELLDPKGLNGEAYQ